MNLIAEPSLKSTKTPMNFSVLAFAMGFTFQILQKISKIEIMNILKAIA